VFHLQTNRNLRKFLVNGEQPQFQASSEAIIRQLTEMKYSIQELWDELATGPTGTLVWEYVIALITIIRSLWRGICYIWLIAWRFSLQFAFLLPNSDPCICKEVRAKLSDWSGPKWDKYPHNALSRHNKQWSPQVFYQFEKILHLLCWWKERTLQSTSHQLFSDHLSSIHKSPTFCVRKLAKETMKNNFWP